LHQVLLNAVQAEEKTQLHLGYRLQQLQYKTSCVDSQWLSPQGQVVEHASQALIGADGINSKLRELAWPSSQLQASGHWAYRTLLPRHTLPAAWRGDAMGLWLGPRLHLVHYPVRGGEWLNVVVLVETNDAAQTPGWDSQRSAAQTAHDLQTALRGSCSRLQDLVRMSESWRAWALFDRHPLQSADDMAQGRLALLGDAAHPMLPYLAQGAGMAIEDAQALAQNLSTYRATVTEQLQAYAGQRWARNARVQARAIRNGRIFHAHGLVAQGRNLSMQLLGERVMDVPWLYGGGPPLDR
jgi:salicylate hydroxylase